MTGDRLSRAAALATLALPIALLHSRAGAEALIALIDAAFLVRAAWLRDWDWLRTPWVAIAAAWWAWLILCSLPGVGIGGIASLGQAAGFGRYLLLVAALEAVALRPGWTRLWLWRVVAACCAYIAAHSVWQAITGRNLYGWPPAGEGELTGPFAKPRAGAPLARLLFPALIPLVDRLAAGGAWRRLGAAGLTIAGAGVMVLIGQRMPVMLTGLGLLLCGLLLPRLRRPVLAALAAAAALLVASAWFHPAPYHRLVTKFATQMEHFPTSDYGLIYGRALVIAGQHPVFGRGFDGFRNACPDPATFQPAWPAPGVPADGGGAGMCNIHPHNLWLQALTDAGVPGLLLFAALAGAWLWRLATTLGRPPAALRVALLASAGLHLWPLASASSIAAVEFAGVFFVLLGWALAEARHGMAWPIGPRPRVTAGPAAAPRRGVVRW